MDFYWDDTCGCIKSGVGHWFASNLIPRSDTIGVVGGVHLLGLFGQDWLDGRFEYARTSVQSYINGDGQFLSGYWTRGHVISDFIGTDGRDYFGRLTARLTPDLMLGLDIDRAVIGSYHKLSKKHLPAYLKEFEFRFNNRENPFLFRDTLLALLSADALPYRALVD